MGKLEKFLTKLFNRPMPTDITSKEAARFLKSIGCQVTKPKGGSSHTKFKYPGYEEDIVLMDNTNLRRYQIEKIKKLVLHLEIVREEES